MSLGSLQYLRNLFIEIERVQHKETTLGLELPWAAIDFRRPPANS